MRSMLGVLVPHHPVIVSADVEPADVIAEDHEDVWELCLRVSGPRSENKSTQK